MVVSAIPNISAVAIAEFYGLMPAHRNGRSNSNAGIPFKRRGIVHPVNGGSAAKPKIAIQRHPKARLKVIAEMPFERTRRALRLRIRSGIELIAGKEIFIGCEEPSSSICIQNPMAPSSRIAEFRLECPAVGAVIDELRGIVLTSGGNHLETGAEDGLLLPLGILPDIHGWAADQVDRKSQRDRKKTRAVCRCFRSNYGTVEVSDSIGKYYQEICATAEEIERMGIVKNRDVDAGRGPGDWDGPVEKNAAFQEGIGQSDGIGMNRRNEISAWGEVLCRGNGAQEKQAEI